jgi:Flp pilus assembly protein TadG
MTRQLQLRNRAEDGSGMIETVLIAPLLLLMLTGAADLGRAFYVAIEVASAAHAGALYGVQNPLDTTGMIAASALDAADVSGLVTTATFGCECSDGTNIVASCATVPTCTSNVVDYVEINTTAAYSSILIYPGVPGTVALKGKARMRAAH